MCDFSLELFENNVYNYATSAERNFYTIEKWLKTDNLVVYPVWIGNLPLTAAVPELRHFLEAVIGKVLISIHISSKKNANERTYAFLNLPTAEKQILAVTSLDSAFFQGQKLIVRSKKPSKFPQSFFGTTSISNYHFKHFRDYVVPFILAQPTLNLNVHAVKKIIEEHSISLENLPNRVWSVQCTLVPNCHRTYCSFYHSHQERELGRIIHILSIQHLNDNSYNIHNDLLRDPLQSSIQVSRHTLLIQRLPKTMSTKKLTEMLEIFGDIDHVIANPNNTCFVRLKRSQDARKIVHLLRFNNSGIQIQFAPYYASNVDINSLSLHRQQYPNDLSRVYDTVQQSYRRRVSLGDQIRSFSHETIDSNATTLSIPSLAEFPSSGQPTFDPTMVSPRPLRKERDEIIYSDMMRMKKRERINFQDDIDNVNKGMSMININDIINEIPISGIIS